MNRIKNRISDGKRSIELFLNKTGIRRITIVSYGLEAYPIDSDTNSDSGDIKPKKENGFLVETRDRDNEKLLKFKYTRFAYDDVYILGHCVNIVGGFDEFIEWCKKEFEFPDSTWNSSMDCNLQYWNVVLENGKLVKPFDRFYWSENNDYPSNWDTFKFFSDNLEILKNEWHPAMVRKLWEILENHGIEPPSDISGWFSVYDFLPENAVLLR